MMIWSHKRCAILMHNGAYLSLFLSMTCQILSPGVIHKIGHFLLDQLISLNGIINMEGNFDVLLKWDKSQLILFRVRFGSYLSQQR